MFGLFKRVNALVVALDVKTDLTYADVQLAHKKIEALEDYLGIEFFQGDKMRAHYRKKKALVKKVGRPKGSKNKREREVIVVV